MVVCGFLLSQILHFWVFYPLTWKVQSTLKMFVSRKSAFSSILLIIFRTEIFAYLLSSFFRGCTTVNLYSLKFWRLCITRYTVICETPLSRDARLVDFSGTSNSALPYLFHNNVGRKWSSVRHQMTHWTASFHRILVPRTEHAPTRPYCLRKFLWAWVADFVSSVTTLFYLLQPNHAFDRHSENLKRSWWCNLKWFAQVRCKLWSWNCSGVSKHLNFVK